MKKYAGQIFLMIIMVPLVMYGATKIQHVLMVNSAINTSTLDSSPVGATTPSTGSFTSLASTSGALNGSIGATTPSTGVFTSATISGLSSGNCVQASTGGLLTTISHPCNPTFTGTSGYQLLPSGLIFEWGLADSGSSSASISFPLNFPNALFSLTYGTGNYGTNASRNVCYTQPAPTTSGFVANSDSSTVHCYWTAIGY